MKGRPRKPTKLHVIQGTARPDRMQSREREPQPQGLLGQPPAWLLPDAKKLWAEIADSYGTEGVLTQLDRSQLAIYCQMWARWMASERARPYVPMPATQVQTMTSIGAKLGLNPSDRTRLKAPVAPERDPFEELLSS
jgi:phage terminase small subunit